MIKHLLTQIGPAGWENIFILGHCTCISLYSFHMPWVTPSEIFSHLPSTPPPIRIPFFLVEGRGRKGKENLATLDFSGSYFYCCTLWVTIRPSRNSSKAIQNYFIPLQQKWMDSKLPVEDFTLVLLVLTCFYFLWVSALKLKMKLTEQLAVIKTLGLWQGQNQKNGS